MAVDLSPPLLTGALVVFQMFFRSRDLSGLNIRAPSKPLWCDRAERLRTDRPRIIPPHDTGAQHAGGRRHAPHAGRPHLTPPPSISYLAPRTGSNLGTPRGAPAHSCTSQRASIVEREVHRRTGKCRHPSCATLAGGTAVSERTRARGPAPAPAARCRCPPRALDGAARTATHSAGGNRYPARVWEGLCRPTEPAAAGAALGAAPACRAARPQAPPKRLAGAGLRAGLCCAARSTARSAYWAQPFRCAGAAREAARARCSGASAPDTCLTASSLSRQGAPLTARRYPAQAPDGPAASAAGGAGGGAALSDAGMGHAATSAAGVHGCLASWSARARLVGRLDSAPPAWSAAESSGQTLPPGGRWRQQEYNQPDTAR